MEGDTKATFLVLISAAESNRRRGYYALAHDYKRAADVLDRVTALHEKLGSASPRAKDLPKWRDESKAWRERAQVERAGPAPSLASAAAGTPVGAVHRAIQLSEAGRSSEALLLLDDALPKLDTATGVDPALAIQANLVAARMYDDALLPTKAEGRLRRAESVAASAYGARDKRRIEPLLRLANHYAHRDEEERAAPHFMSAYDIAVAVAPDKLPESIMGFARVLVARQDPREAIALMEKARPPPARRHLDRLRVHVPGRVHVARGVYEEIDRFDEAEKLLEEVRGLFEPMYRAAPDKLGMFWASYATSVGWHWRKRGDFAKAERFMRESLDIVTKVYPKDSLVTANAEVQPGGGLLGVGRSGALPGPHRALLRSPREKHRAHPRQRLGGAEARLRAGLPHRLREDHDRADPRGERQPAPEPPGDEPGAPHQGPHPGRRHGREPPHPPERRRRHARAPRATRGGAHDAGGARDRGREPERIQKLEEESRGIEAELSGKSAAFEQATREVSIETVRAAIPSGAVLVEIVAFRPLDPLYRKLSDQEPQRYVAFVLHGDGAADPVAVDLGPSDPIDRTAHRLRRGLSDPDSDPRSEASVLYRQVMAPLEPHLRGKTHVVVSPDGALNTVPFAAMRKGDAYLVANYTFTYVTSGRDLLRWGAPSSRTQGLVVMADPAFAMNGTQASSTSPFARIRFPPLPGTATEAEAIHAMFRRSLVLTGKDATEARLKKIERPRVLHLATHGFFLSDASSAVGARGLELDEGVKATVARAENPLLRSGLALAGASTLRGGRGGDGAEDGILTALEAASLDLSGQARGALRVPDGAGRRATRGLRLARAYPGRRGVARDEPLVVDDEATSYLMQGYYARLRDARGRSEALREVQIEMARSKGVGHPYYWAAFIPSGDPGGMTLADEDYAPAPASPGVKRDAPSRPRSVWRDEEKEPFVPSWGEFGFHYLGTTNLRDQADRVGGLVSLAGTVPFFARLTDEGTFRVHDAVAGAIFLGARTSTATEYAGGDSEGALAYGARLGYELALGARMGDLAFFAGGEATYSTFVLGDVKTYGVTTRSSGSCSIRGRRPGAGARHVRPVARRLVGRRGFGQRRPRRLEPPLRPGADEDADHRRARRRRHAGERVAPGVDAGHVRPRGCVLTARAARVVALGGLLTSLGGCLEGDPNPFADAGSATVEGGGGPAGSPSPTDRCSAGSDQRVTLTFLNRTSSDVTVYWVDFDCVERLYATLSPGREHVQPTFVGHPWRLRHAATGAFYKEYTSDDGAAVTVEVP